MVLSKLTKSRKIRLNSHTRSQCQYKSLWAVLDVKERICTIDVALLIKKISFHQNEFPEVINWPQLQELKTIEGSSMDAVSVILICL